MSLRRIRLTAIVGLSAASAGAACGSGGPDFVADAEDGWWFVSADPIALCDRTCERFYEQTIAGKLTAQLGCKTESCMH